MILLLAVGYGYFNILFQEKQNEKRQKICQEFKEMLLLSGTGQRAGYSIENSLINSTGDLSRLFGTKSAICLMLKEVYIARENNQSIHEIFIKAGRETDIEDIWQFGEIYQIAYASSGNMSVIMDKAAQVLIEKLEIRNNAYIALNERIFELKIMNMMPFLIIVYVSLTNPGYFDVMYHNLKGILIMTGVLIVYILSYLWGQKLLREVLKGV